VYGESGIIEVKQVLEPVVTMSFKFVSYLGIAKSSHVHDGKNSHILITNNNEIYILHYNDFQVIEVTKIDCREYINEMGDNLKISYNEERREFYIASNLYSLVVTDKGVTQVDCVVHGVVNMLGRTIPLVTKTNKIGDQL